MFANSVKRHICGGKKIATKACLPSSVDEISRGFYFHETSKFREISTLTNISEFTVSVKSSQGLI